MEELLYHMAHIYQAYWTPERLAAREAALAQAQTGAAPAVQPQAQSELSTMSPVTSIQFGNR